MSANEEQSRHPAVEFTATVAGIREGDGERRGYAAHVKVAPIGGGCPFELYVPFHGMMHPRRPFPGLAFVKGLAFGKRLHVRIETLDDDETPSSGEMTFENMPGPSAPAAPLVWGRMVLCDGRVFPFCAARDFSRALVEVTVSAGEDCTDRRMWLGADSIASFVELDAAGRLDEASRVSAERARRAEVQIARAKLLAVVSTYEREPNDTDLSPVVVEVVAPNYHESDQFGIASTTTDNDWLRSLGRDAQLAGYYATEGHVQTDDSDVRAALCALNHDHTARCMRSVANIRASMETRTGAGVFVTSAHDGLNKQLADNLAARLRAMGFRVVSRVVSHGYVFHAETLR